MEAQHEDKMVVSKGALSKSGNCVILARLTLRGAGSSWTQQGWIRNVSGMSMSSMNAGVDWVLKCAGKDGRTYRCQRYNFDTSTVCELVPRTDMCSPDFDVDG